jgi:hypothetical protein
MKLKSCNKNIVNLRDKVISLTHKSSFSYEVRILSERRVIEYEYDNEVPRVMKSMVRGKLFHEINLFK